MKKELYNILDTITTAGLDNTQWGMWHGGSTKDYFDTVKDIELKGDYIYIYRQLGKKPIEYPTIILDFEDNNGYIDFYSCDYDNDEFSIKDSDIKTKHIYILDSRWKKIYHGIIKNGENVNRYLSRNYFDPRYCEYIVTNYEMYLEELKNKDE